MLKKSKIIFFGVVSSILFVSLIALSIPALAQNDHRTIPDLPEDANFRAIPFKETVIEANGYRAVFKPLITTTNDPSNYISGTQFKGVPVLLLPRTDIDPRYVAVCSGTLLPTGIHILTAAHCVTNDSGNLTLKPNAGAQVRFGGDIDDISMKFFIDVSKTKVHSGWKGDLFEGNDIAVLTLYSKADDIATYEIYQGTDEIGKNAEIVGFGRTGTLAEGDVSDLGIKRNGLNKIDDTADRLLKFFDITPKNSNSILMYDGDNGNEKNDAFGFLLGNIYDDLNDLGIVDDEVLTAGGDSGGPAFYNNKIIGVTSFGLVVGGSFGGSTSDCHKSIVRGSNYPDSSCGEFGGSTRVSSHIAFILDAMGSSTSDPLPPVVVNDSYTTPFETLFSVNAANGVLSNDSGDTLSASVSVPPNNAISFVFNSDGSFTYDPDQGYDGVDSFKYNATDANGVSVEGTVNILVQEPPVELATNLDSQIELTVQNKKRFNNLLVTVTATDNDKTVNNLVSNVSVQLTLSRDGASWDYSGTTDKSGSITFKLMKARSNEDYTATITNWSLLFSTGERDDCGFIDNDNMLNPCMS